MSYTREQIYDAMRQADKAGDADAVRALAGQLQQMDEGGQQSNEQPQYEGRPMPGGGTEIVPVESPQKPSMISQLGHSVANDVAAVGQGLASIPDAATEAMAGGMRMIGHGGAAVGKLVFNALGMPEAAQRVEHNAGLFDQALSHPATIGGVIEKAVPTKPGYETARTVGKLIGGSMIPLPGAGEMPKVPVPTPQSAAADVVKAGDREGVRVMTSDVKPPETFMGKSTRNIGERIPLAGTGGARAAQQGERLDAVKNVLRDYGGSDSQELFESAPSAVEDVASNLAKTRGKEVSRLNFAKNTIIDDTPGEVPIPNTLEAIDQQITRLQGLKSKEFVPIIAKLQDWRASLQGQSLRNVEDLRKSIGSAFEDPNLASIKGEGQKAVNAIYGPLREDMGAFIKAQRGELDFTRWKAANDKLAAMAGELDTTAFRNALRDTETTPEAVGRLLFNRDRSQVARLYANLDPAGKARAQAAILQRAFDKAISADGGLSAEKFTGNLKQLGESVGVAFQGDDKTRIQGLVKLLDSTRRASEAAVQPPTGVQNAPVALGYGLGALFGKAALPAAAIGGLFARAYESAPVRDLLLKLGKAKAGTGAEARLMERAGIAITPIAERYMGFLNDNAAPLSAVGKSAPPQQQQDQRSPQP